MTWRQQEEKDVKQSGTDCWPKVMQGERIRSFFQAFGFIFLLSFPQQLSIKS